MYFWPFVVQANTGNEVEVTIDVAESVDLNATCIEPVWQTDWTSKYLFAPDIDKYAVKSLDGELIALAAYQIRSNSAYVYILYGESAPHSNRL